MKRRAFLGWLGAGASFAVYTAKKSKEKVAEKVVTFGEKLGWIKKGDKFTISGVYAVDPVTRKTTNKLRQFVVTKDNGDLNFDIKPVSKYGKSS